MPHGNGNTAARLTAGLEAILAMREYQLNPKPILINEDSTGVVNLDASVAALRLVGLLRSGSQRRTTSQPRYLYGYALAARSRLR